MAVKRGARWSNDVGNWNLMSGLQVTGYCRFEALSMAHAIDVNRINIERVNYCNFSLMKIL